MFLWVLLKLNNSNYGETSNFTRVILIMLVLALKPACRKEFADKSHFRKLNTTLDALLQYRRPKEQPHAAQEVHKHNVCKEIGANS